MKRGSRNPVDHTLGSSAMASALLGLGRKAEAMALLPKVWTTGFRDPRFIALLRRQGIAAPGSPVG